jgi:hypothetical protein
MCGECTVEAGVRKDVPPGLATARGLVASVGDDLD